MKRTAVLAILFFGVIFSGFSQIDSIGIDTLKLEFQRIPVDTSVLETSKKIIIFREYEDGAQIERINKETGERKMILDIQDGKSCETKKDTAFRGHWSGFEYGLNGFMNNDYTFTPPDGYEYFKLDVGRSWNFNLNFGQSTTEIIKDRLALMGGLGMEINNYSFMYKNNIQENAETGEIEKWYLKDDYDVKKSKIRSMYLTMPALLELQLGKGNSEDNFYLSAGVIGGLRIGSMSKIVHYVNDNKQKLKENKKDLNINRWRWGLHAKMGWSDNFNVFATYYVTPFFEKGKGPELNPFSVGFGVYFGD